MKHIFKEPICDIVRFDQIDIIRTSVCGCNVGGMQFDTNETCTGANTQCTCSPNQEDPSANCD